MLEFVYDGQVKAITATANCTVQYLLKGGGGGGGGYDARAGDSGNAGGIVTGEVYLTAGTTLYCLVGSRGGGGASGASAPGGWAGYALNGYSGGTGGNSGPSGSSGSGGGGGGATLVWLSGVATTIIGVAAGGGGGGGGGLYSNGYYKPNYGLMPNGRGGAGQHHRQDGGGAGGGGGGYLGGFGGLEPVGDNGAMTGSNGTNFVTAYRWLSSWPTSISYVNAGKGGVLSQAGTDGYAYFYSTMQSIYVSQTFADVSSEGGGGGAGGGGGG